MDNLKPSNTCNAVKVITFKDVYNTQEELIVELTRAISSLRDNLCRLHIGFTIDERKEQDINYNDLYSMFTCSNTRLSFLCSEIQNINDILGSTL